jgi:hypothetical protein
MGSWMPKTVVASRVEQGSRSWELVAVYLLGLVLSHTYINHFNYHDDDDDDSLHVLLVARTRVNIMTVAIIQSSQLLQYLQYKRVT